jgi:hypothetical protein
MDEMFQMLFGRSLWALTEIWLAVAYVVSMFVVITFRPQRVGHRVLFRWSYLAFALYLILPAIADGILWLGTLDVNTGDYPWRRMGEPPWGSMAARVLISIVARCLLAISICLGLGSLAFGSADRPQPPGEQ